MLSYSVIYKNNNNSTKNETFFNDAFSAEEQTLILDSHVSAENNPSYSTPPGNSTTDKVFILSISEANKYFNSDNARRCAATPYVESLFQWGSRWLLRSPGSSNYYFAYVRGTGSIVDYGEDPWFTPVRPVMWISCGT